MKQKKLFGQEAEINHVLGLKPYFKHLSTGEIRTQRQAIIEKAKSLFENGARFMTYGDVKDLTESPAGVMRACRKLREIGLFEYYNGIQGQFIFSPEALRQLKIKEADK